MNQELTEEALGQFGRTIGTMLRGGDVIELVGDVGSGKTTLTKSIARGMGVDETVQSPSFTISRVYDTPADLELRHYDFYRLSDAGIMADELAETLHDRRAVTVIEWAGLVDGILPADRLTIRFSTPSEHTRRLELTAGGADSRALLERLV